MRRAARTWLVGALLGAGLLGAAGDALAWCRTAGCDNGVGAQCSPAQATDCGVLLSWPSPCISYSLQADGTRLTSFDTVDTLVRQAFDAWQNAGCSGGSPGLALVATEPVACASRDFDQDGGSNANLIVFRDDDWPYTAKGVLALTTVTYGLDTGTIRDADMEINSQEVAFTFGDENVAYDFLSVVTHESGHFLGLAHSAAPGATMVRDYDRGSTELRSLSDDDVGAICATYPVSDIGACEPVPEGGLRGDCGDGSAGGSTDGDSTDGGCTVAGPGSRGGSGALAFAGVIALVGALRRRRSRRPCA